MWEVSGDDLAKFQQIVQHAASITLLLDPLGVVESVNGATPESAESLRRLLRDALAVGDATVKVKRGETVHTLRVVLPE